MKCIITRTSTSPHSLVHHCFASTTHLTALCAFPHSHKASPSFLYSSYSTQAPQRMAQQPVELFYWPDLPGRGEFIRLALEDAGYPYIDVARGDESKGQGVPALLKLINGEGTNTPPFAPPFIKLDGQYIGQTSLALDQLAPRIGLAPEEKQRTWALQIQLTIADLVETVHSTHHPVDHNGWYKDQKPEAIRCSEFFCKHRLPKFIDYFEKVLSKAPSQYLVGDKLTYVDISLFYVLQGVQYAFPKASARALETAPKVKALYELVGNRPNIKSYLASNRRVVFKTGIFRQEPELDF